MGRSIVFRSWSVEMDKSGPPYGSSFVVEVRAAGGEPVLCLDAGGGEYGFDMTPQETRDFATWLVGRVLPDLDKKLSVQVAELDAGGVKTTEQTTENGAKAITKCDSGAVAWVRSMWRIDPGEHDEP